MPPKENQNLPFVTRDMLDFETGTTFSLLVVYQAITTSPYIIRGFTKQGPFSFQLISTGTGTKTTIEFAIPDVPIMVSMFCLSAIEKPTLMNARIYLAINKTKSILLTQGMPDFQNAISWPNQVVPFETQKRGVWTKTTGANPAVGAEISDSVPTNKFWRLKYVEFTLVTAAAAATRSVSLLIDPTGGGTMTIPTAATQIISETKKYIFYEGASPVNNLISNTIVTPLPQDLWLPFGTAFTTVTTNLNAGDDFGAPIYRYEEYLTANS